MSSEHARVWFNGERYFVHDLRSTNGTAVVRGDQRIALDECEGRETALHAGDVVEFGTGENVVRVAIAVVDDVDATAHVLAMRKIDELGRVESTIERDDGRLRALYDAQKRIGSATELTDVLVAICDAAFALVAGATHVTVVLRDDDDEAPRGAPADTSPSSRASATSRGRRASRSPSRGASSARSSCERAAVIAADAPARWRRPSRSSARRSGASSRSRSGRARTSSASCRSTTA